MPVYVRVFVMRCGFGPVLAPHFTVRFKQNHNCTESHFCGHMCGAVWCGVMRFRVSENYNRTVPHFYGHLCGAV